jgi:hypothetical protein
MSETMADCSETHTEHNVSTFGGQNCRVVVSRSSKELLLTRRSSFFRCLHRAAVDKHNFSLELNAPVFGVIGSGTSGC